MSVDARSPLIVLAAGSALLWLPPAVGQTLPHYDDDTHLGVATCASATCHGAAAPPAGGVVLQNEYTTWQTQDPHAGAYNLLLEEDSRRIARNLGLPDAHTADICLDCHTDNVPEEHRGERFQLSDGVGCEACHGGAENWIRLHTVSDNAISHQRNIDAGLYPTSDPVARAELCLSCHLGDDQKFATHRIMGAGHPRMSFEIDTFTAIQPAHFVIDDDYAERKRVVTGTKLWAIGQAIATAEALEGVVERSGGGLFPELTYFDCHACHKSMESNTWRSRASLGLGPGVVRFNDSSLIMTRIAAEVIDPALARQLRDQGRALHRSSQSSPGAFRSAASQLEATARRAADVFGAHDFTEADLRRLLDAMIAEGERGEYVDYAAAEQTSMAIGSLLTAMTEAGWMNDAEFAAAESAMADIYAAVEEDDSYRPNGVVSALRELKGLQ